MVNENIDIQFYALGPVIEEYSGWFNTLLCALHDTATNEDLTPPKGFTKWLKESGDIPFHNEFIKELNEQAAELQKKANAIIDHGSLSNVDQESFSSFVSIFDSFTGGMRRLERDLLYAGTGLDPLTGLRDTNALQNDFANDLELLRRYDQPFSLVFVRLDNYENLKAKSDEKDFLDIIKNMGSVIRRSIRTFDEAYHLGNGEFVMVCKHTAKAGGTVVTTRLNNILDKKKIKLETGSGQIIEPTLSYCVSEPAPGQKLDALLSEMREDIGCYCDDSNVSIEHMELSPLQRFLGNSE